MILPGECLDAFHGILQGHHDGPQAPAEKLDSHVVVKAPVFCRVVLRLGDMLDGAFFTDYIKSGGLVFFPLFLRLWENGFIISS